MLPLAKESINHLNDYVRIFYPRRVLDRLGFAVIFNLLCLDSERFARLN